MLNENSIRQFFEAARWSLQTQTLASSKPMQKLMNELGAEDFSVQWQQIRTLPENDYNVLQRAFSNAQIESKLWLVDILRGVLPTQPYNICVLGGWVGVLGRLLHWRTPELVRRLVLVDSDPEAIDLARRMHGDLLSAKKIELICADADEMIFDHDFHLIINSACEHFSRRRWFENIPAGRIVAMQASDDLTQLDHVDCVTDMKEFRLRYPVELSLYKGVLATENGHRFTIVGRK